MNTSVTRQHWRRAFALLFSVLIRNFGVRNRLIPMTAAPEGSIDTYRIGAGRGWTLKNSFNF
jgi:hypothetical protein